MALISLIDLEAALTAVGAGDTATNDGGEAFPVQLQGSYVVLEDWEGHKISATMAAERVTGIEQGDTITVNGTSYYVLNVRSWGNGLVSLDLSTEAP